MGWGRSSPEAEPSEFQRAFDSDVEDADYLVGGSSEPSMDEGLVDDESSDLLTDLDGPS